MTRLTPWRFSISLMAARFSFSRKLLISTGTCATTRRTFSFSASSSISRSTASALDSTVRIKPWPLQRGHTCWLDSPSDGRRRWRDISNRPKREMRPRRMRARSCLKASASRFSTRRWLAGGVMSMKSITIRPPRSRRRNWRATSSAASRLVCSAVSSMLPRRVARAELMSIVVSASVWSMTMAPPDGSETLRSNTFSIWLSTCMSLNSGAVPSYSDSFLESCGAISRKNSLASRYTWSSSIRISSMSSCM